MTTERDRIIARTAEATQALRSIHIDLAAFLALTPEQRAARWRQFDRGAKHQLVCQAIVRQTGRDWEPTEVEAGIAHYDAKWDVAGPDSDLAIPPAADILAVVKDRYDLAVQHDDIGGARQLDRVRANLIQGARLVWCLGDLLIQSVNHPGLVYSVNRRGCTCPNGAAGRSDCWHVALYDLLLDMQEEAATTADMEADRAEAQQEAAHNNSGPICPWARAAALARAALAADDLYGKAA
jgi:hypothetical protein